MSKLCILMQCVAETHKVSVVGYPEKSLLVSLLARTWIPRMSMEVL